jgi:hypothetical protein
VLPYVRVVLITQAMAIIKSTYDITHRITTEGGAETDIKVRIGKARSVFIRLDNIWKTTVFSKKIKLKLYNSCTAGICWRFFSVRISSLSFSDWCYGSWRVC